MKKLLFSLAAMVALVATSCVQADVEDINLGGNEGVVTFVIKTDALGSRTGDAKINDGAEATALSYGIYDKDWTLIKTDTATMVGLSKTLELRLVKNKTYNFAFWAQSSDESVNGLYTVDFEGKKLTVNYDYLNTEGAKALTANNDLYDAFYGTTTVTVDNGAVNKPVELKRPFAQINFAAADTSFAEEAGYDVDAATTEFVVTAYTEMNLTNGVVDTDSAKTVTATFSATTNPTEQLELKDGTKYDWLAMNYILVPGDEVPTTSLTECKMKITNGSENAITIDYPMAPAKRNWRTNLVGNLLTEAAVIKVEINPMPENEYNLGFEVSNGVAQVTNEQGLAKVAELINSTEEGSLPADTDIVLNGDLDLAELAALFRSEEVSNWTPIGTSAKPYTGTFDGNGYTIKNLVINGGSNSNIGFFGVTHNGEIKNLTIENAKVSGRLNVGVVAGQPYTTKYTNITVKGHIEVNGMAYVGAVGGKNAYADWTNIEVEADATSYVKAHSIENGTAYRTYVGGVCGFNGEGGHTFKNITSNIKVEGSTCDVGGLFGIAHYGNKFENCVCTGDVLLYATDEESAGECGGIAGVWHNQAGYTVTLTNCSHTGTVKATSENGEVYFDGKKLIGSAYSATGTGTLVVNGLTPVSTADELVAALEANKGVAFLNDIKIEPAKMSNAYGATGINVKNGQTIDGNGYTLNIKGAGGTWDSGINTTGGLIKNLTVTGSFRGIFVNHTSTHSEKVVLESVTIGGNGTVYTLSCDQGLYQGIEATNCTFNGWTSFAKTAGEAKFTNCSFGEGSGYAFCRPYAKSEFVNCEFKNAYAFDTNAYGAKPELAFKGCKYNGVAITAENATSLYTGEEVFLYNGLNNLTIE